MMAIRSFANARTLEVWMRAIKANPRAKKAFGSLSKIELFALRFRTNNMKTPEGRRRKIEELVSKLANGQLGIRK